MAKKKTARSARRAASTRTSRSKRGGESGAPRKRTATSAKKKRAATGASTNGKPARAARRPRALRLRESQAARKARAGRILAKLRELYPDADCALRHASAYELLVATILSAQCTDERVNMVTPNLFRMYPDAKALAAASQEDLEAAIRSTGFYRNKAKNLLGMARKVCDEFGGEIPDSMDQLLTLPGVARKTANCVLGTWFGKNVGIVVDTHVGRLAQRLGLLRTAKDDKDAVKIERDLMELFPEKDWTFLAHALIQHGRRVCAARKPKCSECVLAEDCPSAE
ncbi:MAG: endonuclease III [Planctomycetota bacterium]|nr:MAG: endonuclease III [Planctomycetota bacterium]